jgi:ornithine cyclodeaminase/alanine dehydrogenase-like protein (mu-crystallin family)
MWLDEAAVRELLDMEEVISAMDEALADFSSGKVVQPVRTMVPVAEHRGFFFLMPAYTGQALGAKLVAFYPHNAEVPTHHAIIQLFRPETGEPLATMDGRLITEMRTAAVSAVATKYLARADAAVLAIIGSGVQARRGVCARVRDPRGHIGRGGRAGCRRGGHRDYVPDTGPAWSVAVARRAHQRGRGAPPGLARAG